MTADFKENGYALTPGKSGFARFQAEVVQAGMRFLSWSASPTMAAVLTAELIVLRDLRV